MPTLEKDTPIVVVGFPGGWGLCSPSPFAVKLETFLRIAEVPYTTAPLSGPPKSPTGKFPYLALPDGRVLADSSVIIDELQRARALTVDAQLSGQQRAVLHLIQRMVEEHLYFALVWARWARDEGFGHVGAHYFTFVPAPVRPFAAYMARRAALAQLQGQGIGRHPEARVLQLLRADLTALEQLLPEDGWVFGAPGRADAICFGFIASLLGTPGDCPAKALTLSFPKVCAHTERVRARYWSA
jgi:glutathione S-transferase